MGFTFPEFIAVSVVRNELNFGLKAENDGLHMQFRPIDIDVPTNFAYKTVFIRTFVVYGPRWQVHWLHVHIRSRFPIMPSKRSLRANRPAPDKCQSS